MFGGFSSSGLVCCLTLRPRSKRQKRNTFFQKKVECILPPFPTGPGPSPVLPCGQRGALLPASGSQQQPEQGWLRLTQPSWVPSDSGYKYPYQRFNNFSTGEKAKEMPNLHIHPPYPKTFWRADQEVSWTPSVLPSPFTSLTFHAL